MRLGLIGRGPWGEVYARTLRNMGMEFWEAGRDWIGKPLPDAAIVACRPEYHFKVAKYLIAKGVPMIIEKPVCMKADDASRLLRQARHFKSIVFTNHTRLYSNAWRAFKARALAQGVRSVRAVYGGASKIDPLWDYGSHLVAMALDLGFDPLKASITTSRDEHPLTFMVNHDMVYLDQPETPTPLEVLLREFMAAIENGETDIRGLELGVKVVEALEEMSKIKETA